MKKNTKNCSSRINKSHREMEDSSLNKKLAKCQNNFFYFPLIEDVPGFKAYRKDFKESDKSHS